MIASALESNLVEVKSEEAAARLNVPLPPSERDFEVYGLVVVEGASTRAAAAAVGLSQTRVMQIRNRVAEWIASEVPPLANATPAQRLNLAGHIARDRFDFLYSQAMDGWRESRGPQTSVRTSSQGRSTVKRPGYGEPRYLLFAARIVEKSVGLNVAIEKAGSMFQASASKVSGEGSGFGVQGSGSIEAVKEPEARNKEPEAADQQPRVTDQEIGLGDQSSTESHPVGGCSLPESSESVRYQAESDAAFVSDVQPVVSDENRRRRRAFLRGTQEPFADCSPTSNANRGSAAHATIPRK